MAALTLRIWIISLLCLLIEASFICDETSQRFRCASGECISKFSKCDFKQDCSDGSDEDGCDYPTCNPQDFQCKNGKCIELRWVCDEEDDCYDDSDEEVAMCKNHTCQEDHYRCKGSGTCIPNSWKCDGEIDCEKEDDEKDCPKIPCTDKQFECDNGECIDADFRCDGDDDCRDGSDEVKCQNKICKDDQFQCTTHPQCIPFTWKCDSTADCEDETDEANCTNTAPRCPDSYFACHSGPIRCIPKRWKCDGNAECDDKSDELRCDNIIDRCSYGEFHCHNKRQCIPGERECDGTRDCVDRSDEMDCPDSVPDKTKCPATTHFRCPGEERTCIVNHRLCDTYPDCPNGEDEKKGPHFCDYNECSEMNGNCSHICNDLRLGYHCSCPDGYKLEIDQKSCEDVNECESVHPQCQHLCVNLIGSFKCTCWTGHEMDPLTHSCKATNASADVSMMIADKNGLRKINLHRNPFIQDVLLNISVTSVAVDIANDYVYWADPKQETISRSKTSSLHQKSEVILEKVSVTQMNCLAVDWIHDHLYWSDMMQETLSVSYLNGSFPKTLLTTQQKVFKSMAIHPTKGYIFLGVYSNPSYIQRCGLDGADCINVITEKIQFPSDIAVDYQHNLIYWSDAMLQAIFVSGLDGKNQQSLRYVEDFEPFSLAVFAGKIYWSEFTHRSIFSMNSSGADLQVVDKNIRALMDFVILHPRAQEKGASLCANSPCKFMCLPRAYGSSPPYSCACPDHYTVKENDATDCRLIALVAPFNPQSKTATTIPPSTVSTTTSTTPNQNRNSTIQAIQIVHKQMSIGSKVLIGIGIFALLILCSALACLVFRWHKRRSDRRSMNFNNPIYRKVTNSQSFTGNDEQSMHSSVGDVSNPGSLNTDPSAGLIINEEMPGASTGRPSDNSAEVNPKNGQMYTKVKSDDFEIEYVGLSST